MLNTPAFPGMVSERNLIYASLCIHLQEPAAPSPPEDEIPVGQRLKPLPELHSKEI